MSVSATNDLPFEDRRDFDDADRGFVAAMDPCIVSSDDGRVVWDNDAYGFLDGDCPGTANPSLWRQSQLCAKQGLFEVTEGIYQVRGLDLSNMTLVEGDTGVIVIDPLISKETAAAALALYREHRGDRDVAAVIYTHAHGDHFGGVHGIYKEGVPIVAGHGFMEAAVAENVYAGAAMNRRAEYMYGAQLEKGPRGQIGAGLGSTRPSASGPRTAPGATSTSREPTSCATASSRPPSTRWGPPTWSGPSRSTNCSTRSPSGSTDPGRGRNSWPSTGSSPTWGTPTERN